MQCSRCGATVVSQARFCPVCGMALSAPPATDTAATGVARMYDATVMPATQIAADPNDRPTSRLAQVTVLPQIRRWWWKILLIGIGVYLAVNQVFVSTSNVFLLPQLFVIGTFLVPIVYIAYLYEDGTLYDVPLSKVALIFFFGGVVGTLAASLLESRLITTDSKGVFGQLSFVNATLVGISEEIAKLIVLVPFIVTARRRYPTIMHGIVLGATAGMGFAAFESMGYAFAQLILSGHPETMNQIIRLRALLAPLGHGTWTAIVAAAIWREVVNGRPALNSNVLVAFIAAVVLHLLWDFLPPLVLGGLPVLHIILGLVGLLLLRFFLLGAKGQQGAAYQERNLATALRLYASDLKHTFRGRSRP